MRILIALTVLVGLIFGLPHVLIPRLLPAGSRYTPFATSGISSITYDETVQYGPAVNYTARTMHLPYDPSTYEYRNSPAPEASFPYFVVAPFQWLSGSAAAAFIAADFLFPALAFVLGVLVLRRAGVPDIIAIAASLLMLIPAPGLRNMLDTFTAAVTGNLTNMVAPLDYSRFPYSEFSFR